MYIYLEIGKCEIEEYIFGSRKLKKRKSIGKKHTPKNIKCVFLFSSLQFQSDSVTKILYTLHIERSECNLHCLRPMPFYTLSKPLLSFSTTHTQTLSRSELQLSVELLAESFAKGKKKKTVRTCILLCTRTCNRT